MNHLLTGLLVAIAIYFIYTTVISKSVTEGFYPWWRPQLPWWRRGWNGNWWWGFTANDAYYRPNFYPYYSYY